MPNFKSHIFWIFAIIVSLLCVFFFKSIKAGFIPLIIYLYAGLPDIDHHIGKMRKKLLKVFFLILVLSGFVYLWKGIEWMLLYLTVSGILGFLMMSLKHRGIMHKFLFGVVMSLPLLYIGYLYFLVGFVAYSSHLVLDKITRKRTGYGKVVRKVTKIWG